MTQKYNILFSGWFNVAHSYAIINCFQLLALYENYKDRINFYIDERPYYNPEWSKIKKLVYGDSLNKILMDFQKYNKDLHKIDLEYRCTYEYDITVKNPWPVCIFYTAEFNNLEPYYFKNNNIIQTSLLEITDHIHKNINKLYFTAPTKWSADGLTFAKIPNNHNKVITHGVSSGLLQFKENGRQMIRNKYNIKDDDIVLLNIGALTGNKSILLILQVLNIIVNRYQKKNYKLILKGSKDLYNSQLIVKGYLDQLPQLNITSSEIDNLINNYIILIFDTLTYEEMANLYSAGDLYLSPFIAEGFNLTPLEALSCLRPIVIPETGASIEYAKPIFENDPEINKNFIYFIRSKVIDSSGKKINEIDGNHFLEIVLNFKKSPLNSEKLLKYLNENYSWSKVSHLLFKYFEEIIR